MTPSKNDRERSGSNKGKKDASSVESNTDMGGGVGGGGGGGGGGGVGARKREMEEDCVSDKSWPIEISAGTGAHCERQEARKMAKTGKASAGTLH